MNDHHPSTHARTDAGVTLVEIVVAVVISTLVMGVLAAVLSTSMSAAGSARDIVLTSNDSNLIATFFSRDVQSVGRSDPGAVSFDPTVVLGLSTESSPAGWAGCEQSGTLVVRFAWVEGTVSPTVVTYALTSAGELVRTSCSGGASSSLTLASQVQEASVTCLPVPGCGGLATMAGITVNGTTEAGTDYEVSLMVAVRPEPATTTLDGQGAPLVLLGSTTCPTFDLAATTVVQGLAVVDGTCGVAPIVGDMVRLVSEDTLLGDVAVDPLGALEDPFDRCAVPGPEPAIGDAPSADAWVVHRQRVRISGDVAFDPGRYVFCDGVEVLTGASVTGSSVVWFVAAGPTSVAAGSHVRLVPPSAGPYATLSLWTASTDGVDLAAGDSVDTLAGVVYAPSGTVRVGVPRGLHVGGVVAEGLDVSGAGVLRIGRPIPQLGVGSPVRITSRRDQAASAQLPPVTGGTAPYRWEERMLVPGLWLASNGSISGVPVTLGTTTVDAIVRDATGATLVVPVTVEVVATPVGCPSTDTGWWGQYWTNNSLTGAAALCRVDAALSFDWGGGSPAPSIPADDFSARWTRVQDFAAGQYLFQITSDDGVRLYIDGVLVWDRWVIRAPTTDTVPVTLTAGLHTIVFEYYERGGGAVAALSWAPRASATCPATVTGWRGEYFDTVTPGGTPALCRDDPAVDFDWGGGGPLPAQTERFSARWTRTQEFLPGTYTFEAGGDDGVRLYVDGVPVVDDWRDTAYFVRTVTRDLTAGPHTIVMEFYENYGLARATLRWSVTSVPGAPRNVVASPGDTTARIDWNQGVTSGEAATTQYTVRATAAGQATRTCTATPPATTCQLTGLVNGVRYDVAVTATNVTGTSAAGTTSVVSVPAALTGSSAELWLDARDPDGDGTAEGASENCDTTVPCSTADALIRWRDKSGRGNHAVQTTSAQAGRFDAASSAVNFDANGWYDVNVGVSPDMTTFVVAQSDTPAWNTYGWVAAARGPNGWIIHPWPGSAWVGWYTVNSSGTYLAPIEMIPPTITAPHVYDLMQSGSNPVTLTAGLDGTTRTAISSAGQTRTAGTVRLRLGADDCCGSRRGDGKFREVIVLDAAIPAADRRAIQEYLARKWSIAIVPSAPGAPNVVPGDGAATVSWPAPAWDGGAALTGYTVTASPGGATCTTGPGATSCTVTGLANGTAHTFTVTATNAVGTGPASTAATIAPGPPSAPTALTLIGGNSSATASWTPPAANGQAPITAYTVTATAPSAPTVTCTTAPPSTGCSLNGLVNGRTYTVSVTATNSVGTGAASAPATVTPDDPSNPTTVTPASTVSGTVFEDVNYGGGAGRPSSTAGAAGVANARVELYDAAGLFVGATTTGPGGTYAFTGLGSGSYHVRVVTGTVGSTRPVSGAATRVPVLTYRTSWSGGTLTAVTDHVGGRNPALADAGAASTGSSFSPATGVFASTPSGTAQAVAPITLTGPNATGIDFGFNFATVVNTNDAGPGSLRQVITNANALGNDSSLAVAGRTPGIEHVVFMIPDGVARPGLRSTHDSFTTTGGSQDVATIALSSGLPSISTPMVIDAQLQPGWVDRPIVELNGAFSAGDTSRPGLDVVAGGSGSAVRGLLINRFGGRGISVTGASNVSIQGNWIGLAVSGNSAAANGTHGIVVSGGSGVIIGGTTATQRNILSGNASFGVAITSAGTDGTVIQGNYVGVGPGGTAAVPNGSDGVVVQNGAVNTLIGGTAAGSGNLISGNGRFGVSLTGAISTTIQANLIGTNAAGTAAMANGSTGISITSGSTGSRIGGTDASARNLVSGNTGNGIGITSSPSTVVEGNWIGVNALGTGAIPNTANGVAVTQTGTNPPVIGGSAPGAGNVISGNAGRGVSIEALAAGVVVQGNIIGRDPGNASNVGNGFSGVAVLGPGNVVGGTAPGQANVIAGNASAGVYLAGVDALGNRVSGNSIFGNLLLGIELSANAGAHDGVTPNDGATSTGPNAFIDRPVFTSATLTGTTLTVSGHVGSAAGQAAFANHVVEVFVADPDATGSGEGRTFLGAITTDPASGTFTGTITISPTVVQVGTVITGTAIDPSFGNTSEFSANRTVS